MHQIVIFIIGIACLTSQNISGSPLPGTAVNPNMERIGMPTKQKAVARVSIKTVDDTAELIRFRFKPQLHTIPEETDHDVLFQVADINNSKNNNSFQVDRSAAELMAMSQVDERGQNVQLIRDYDPQIQQWTFPHGLTFENYNDAYVYARTKKSNMYAYERLLNIRTALISTTRRSYQHPNGGWILQSPFGYGVKFSDESLDWLAYLPIPKQRDHVLVIGHFKDSRSAALAYNVVTIRLKKQYGAENVGWPKNTITKRESALIDLTEVEEKTKHFLTIVTGQSA